MIIHDLQTRVKSHFICEKWLAIDKDDFQIEHTFPISLKQDKNNLKYLIPKQFTDTIRDSHLWFSLIARPVHSSFSRLDRLTCCFVLMSISMLMNILYYGMDNSPSSDGLKIGPYINLTLQQISIGIITNLIDYLPSLLLVQLFKRIKRRRTHAFKLNKILNGANANKPEKCRHKFELKFPWWFKIIAYFISFVFAAVSLFFVIIKGILFGDEKVAKWLTSLIISLLSSILLTQPLQVLKIVTFNLTLVYVLFMS